MSGLVLIYITISAPFHVTKLELLPVQGTVYSVTTSENRPRK